MGDCGHALPVLPTGHCGGTGYALDASGRKICYQCCADNDRAEMIASGRITLYLVRRDKPEQLPGPDMQRGMVSRWYVTNWPATLEFPTVNVHENARGGGFGSQRTDAYFTGPDGKRWHAVNRGDSQIARCHRLAKQ
jgi:hypothetical protein